MTIQVTGTLSPDFQGRQSTRDIRKLLQTDDCPQDAFGASAGHFGHRPIIMSDLLTVKQLQELLRVDRVTIYRMLNDGRLPGFKVGKQWRFSRQAIDEWLASQQPEPKPAPSSPISPADLANEVLPISCLQPIQDIYAYATGVGALTTDLEGNILISLSNNADFCQLIQSTAKGQALCRASWKALTASAEDKPIVRRCHAGLCYTCQRVKVNGEPVAAVFCGQYLLTDDDLARKLADLAAQCGLDQSDLEAAAASLPRFDAQQVEWLTGLLDKVGEAFSHIALERRSFLERLSRIADMATV